MLALVVASVVLVVVGSLAHQGRADDVASCSCGYLQGSDFLWMDSFTTDFVRLQHISDSPDWSVQRWTSPYNASLAPYGRSREARNIVTNPATTANGNLGANGELAGLELWVRPANETTRIVPSAELQSSRDDIQYGSFRAGIMTTDVLGTAGAFFWYRNDSQEIDVELLSSETTTDNSIINMVLQSWAAYAVGDASHTLGYSKQPLGFASDREVHEYRFDWTSTTVTFYIDGKELWRNSQPDEVPSSGGNLVLNHWSNGNPGWTRGPPLQDAKMMVTYVEVYFNSSSDLRKRSFDETCQGTTNFCIVPESASPPPPISTTATSTAQPSSTNTESLASPPSGASQTTQGAATPSATHKPSEAPCARETSVLLWILIAIIILP